MDDVICDYSGSYKLFLDKNSDIKYPQSQYGFFNNLSPIEGAVEAVKSLILDERYEPYILTAPSELNPLSYTEKRVWIERYFGIGFVSKLIICSNKGLLKGDILIDDHCEGKGQENFGGKLIHFGTNEYPNWIAVASKLAINKPENPKILVPEKLGKS
jgi:5'(3')-deoxyribonucleotidase